MKELRARNIGSHIAGVTTGRDYLFLEHSIAISGIFRAKGNEAPMVYVLDAEYCFSGFELARKRNILFTSITRSRGWVRICGVGSQMEELKKEVDDVIGNDFQLKFEVPTQTELEKIRKIHRDMSAEERKLAEKSYNSLTDIVSFAERGDLNIESLPKELRDRLLHLLGGNEE